MVPAKASEMFSPRTSTGPSMYLNLRKSSQVTRGLVGSSTCPGVLNWVEQSKLKEEEIEILLNELNLKEILSTDNESILDKKYFSISPYRKIKHKLIFDIISARIDELIDICINKNSNLRFLKKDIVNIYLKLNSMKYFKNIQYILENGNYALALDFSHNYLDEAYKISNTSHSQKTWDLLPKR